MQRIGRSILSVLAGLMVGAIVIGVVEAVSSAIYPPPPGFDPNDRAALEQFIATLPVTAMLFVVLAWALGTFAGAWVAAKLANRAPLTHALVIGGFYFLAGVANLAMVPHPVWMWVVGLAVFPTSAYLAGKLVGRGV